MDYIKYFFLLITFFMLSISIVNYFIIYKVKSSYYVYYNQQEKIPMIIMEKVFYEDIFTWTVLYLVVVTII